ncbi:translocator protein [Geopyxis carbonaria]|nr:translocator protein [Geopyxis carbonaria]
MPLSLSSVTLPAVIFSSSALSILLPVGTGCLIGYATKPSKTKKTYNALKQPPLRPPPWVFAPVWTALYGLMGYASYRVTRIGLSSASPTIRAITMSSQTLYTGQLALNFLWMPLFFGLKRPVSALVDIVALVGCVGALAWQWKEVDMVSALCLLPYLSWLCFATYITAGVGYLNKWDIEGAVSKFPKQ